MLEAEILLSWAERNVLSLTADHISGVDNARANWLSRELIGPAEWQLHPNLFREATLWFGSPVIDLFASQLNAQLPCYMTRHPCLTAENYNALRCPWPAGLLYAFPPIPLIPRVIRKLLDEKADLLVASDWPRRPWYADLVALSVDRPWVIPPGRLSLCQGAISHPEPQWLQLAVWHLKGSS